jgi:hypothetical protein
VSAITVLIENVYEDGDSSRTRITVTDPYPVEGPDDAIEQWWEDNVYPHTGTGRVEDIGCGYFCRLDDAPDQAAAVGAEWVWGI